jgi:predicted exporter
MEPRRQKLQARVLLALFAGLGLAWLAHLDRPNKISTDVLDLVPGSERSPELAMVRSLASERQARVALFVLDVPARAGEDATAQAKRRDAAAAAFVKALAASPAFVEAMPVSDTKARNDFGRYLFEQRFELLLPDWLDRRARDYAAAKTAQPWPDWLAERAATELEGFLTKAEALPFQDLLPSDPFLLVPALAGPAQAFAEAAPGGGASNPGQALIWGQVKDSPLREEGQAPVFSAVDQAWAAAKAVEPATGLRWTAISRFAAESRARIEKEMSLLNLLSFAAVLAVAAVCVRKLPKVLHLAPVILGSLLGAWVATTLFFDRVHVLVFVVGSLLGGVAVDYGFYLYLQPRRHAGETYREKVGRLIKPLLASSLTAVIGFSLLLLSELPLIRQLGVFVSAGLLSALMVALLWFAQIDNAFLETRDFIRARLKTPSLGVHRAAQVTLALGAIVALVGPWRLHWHDDIRELQIPTPDLNANDAAVRALFGESENHTFYLTRGDTPSQAREALTRFLDWHAKTFPEAAVGSLGLAVPTEAAWRTLPTQLGRLGEFEPTMKAALQRHGFDPLGFDPFFTDLKEFRRNTAPRKTYDQTIAGLMAQLHGPMSLLLAFNPGSSWIATIGDHPPGAEPPPETATVSTDQLQTLNQLFSRYRDSALRLSSIGLGLVGLSVLVLYGVWHGLKIFAIPAGACLFAFGLLGFAGQTLNLFHLLGAFLGVCLSHNYAIFSAENALSGEEPPPSIRLSALCTATSFGVLALSKIPVVAALGLTVALIVVTALAMVELMPLAAKPRQRP